MFVYEKKLQYPVKIANPNPKLAAAIISQYGGPDGELGASLRYLSQRYSMPYPELKGLLTDIGTEELGHLEMVGTIVHQLTRNLSEEDIRTAGFDTYPAAVLDVVFGRFSPVGKLPITLPRGDEVLAVNAKGVCISPNDVPGYDKDKYMPDSLKDENGKAYAYRDAAGNYYELDFGLSF